LRRVLCLLLLVGLAVPAALARGGGAGTYAVVPGPVSLPTAYAPNGADLQLSPAWMSPPTQPVELTYDQLLELWRSAGEAYAVPWNVLAAINKIESNFGRNMGPSSAGAIGWMQFMPSTWLRWGTDANGDGIADPWNPVDAIYSAARYLAASGASSDVRRAVFSYNHATWYVNDVMSLAQLYAGSGSVSGAGSDVGGAAAQPAFALDKLQVKLGAARAAVTRVRGAYRVAVRKARVLAQREQAAAARADSLPLLSDRLAAQKWVARAGVVADSAQARVDLLGARLDAAREKLTGLRDEAQGASFNQPVRQLLSAAPVQGSGNYVFPVGGGPSVVSVSHSHHDYPAADIAAPEGSPLYALTDATVLYAWQGDPRCGTGFTFQAGDGQTWTYCHLSYIDPTVQPGAQLTAGQPVGLVGSTGDATGPHLHLQLQPATSYPQTQEWFESFAGTAFQWSDGSQPAGSPAPLVFHIVRPGE
jgi:murein DD-endopeptidase MepM/ murein hydrolase activator NlpD